MACLFHAVHIFFFLMWVWAVGTIYWHKRIREVVDSRIVRHFHTGYGILKHKVTLS